MSRHRTGTRSDDASATALLDAVGIPVLRDRDAPDLRGECMRISRRLRITGKRLFGLGPADEKSAVPPVAVQLGIALMELSGSTVAYLDANTRWPALPADLVDTQTSAAVRESESRERSPFSTRWLFESLALLVPRTPTRAGDAVPQLERLLFDGVELFEYVLVDLTGFDRLGELDGAVKLMDFVILVARAAGTRERDLLDLKSDLDPDRILGALLVG